MIDQEKLLRLKVYSEKIKNNSEWVDKRIMTLLSEHIVPPPSRYMSQNSAEMIDKEDLKNFRDMIKETCDKFLEELEMQDEC